MKVGLIGFGRLGKLLHHYLANDCQIIIHDPFCKDIPVEKNVPLDTLADSQIIIIAVPISQFEATVIQLSKYLRNKSCLIIDVCSVKMLPIQIMKRHLPSTASILGTHPMFGPDSARDTLFGRKIVLTPERIDPNLYRNLTLYLQNHGLYTFEETAEKHDRQIATSLNLTHLIGRALLDFKATNLDIDTKGYRRLIKILETVENDSWQLFLDMNRYNPFAKETLEKFQKSLEKMINLTL